MAEETAEEAAQRVNAKRLAASRESKKRKCAEESQEQRENRLASQREITKRKCAKEAAQRVNSNINFSINPTMVEGTAEETVQRVNAKRIAANRESKKRKYIKII